MTLFPTSTTIALCYPGDLGSVLGRLLADRGHTLLTVPEGRSPRTWERIRSHGFTEAPTLTEAVAQADVVLSVVPPATAGAVLSAVLEAASMSHAAPVYVDANSIGPDTARTLEAQCRAAGLAMVDMTVQGQASGLPGRGDLFLSGPDAPAVAGLFGPDVSCRIVGTEVGEASRFKLLLSTLYKSMTALFLETASNARRAGVLDEFLETTRSFYPGMVNAVERMLPTYPRHAGRRVDELREAEAMLEEMGVRPGMVREARNLLQRLASSPVCNRDAAVPPDDPLALLTELTDALNQSSTEPLTQEMP